MATTAKKSTTKKPAIKYTIKVEHTTAPLIRVTAKKDIPEYGIAAGDVFYLGRSDENNGLYYVLRWSYQRVMWLCGCPATTPCKHIERVVQHCHKRRVQMNAIKKAEKAAAEKKVAPVVVASTAPQNPQNPQTTPCKGTDYNAVPLLTSSQGFSLLREVPYSKAS